MRRTSAAVIALFVISFPTTSWAQPTPAGDADQAGPSIGDFQHRLKGGKKIYVTERDGREMTGRFVELTPVALVVTEDGTRREIPLAVVRQIQTPDPVWTGALLGAGIGAAIALTIRTDIACPTPSAGCLNEVKAARVGFPLWGGLIGLGLDKLHNGRKTIYRASDGKTVSAAATIAPGRRALAVAIIF